MLVFSANQYLWLFIDILTLGLEQQCNKAYTPLECIKNSSWGQWWSNEQLYFCDGRKKIEPLHMYSIRKSPKLDYTLVPYANARTDQSSDIHCLGSIQMEKSLWHRGKSCARTPVKGVRQFCHWNEGRIFKFSPCG